MRKDNTKKDIVNEQITSPEVFLIGEDGQKLGVKPLHRALQKAEQKGLDLMLVNPLATPPVAKICDSGKLLFSKQKRAKANKKKSASTQIKNIQMRYKIDSGDKDHKLQQARKFLEKKHTVRMELFLRGREQMFFGRLLELKKEVMIDLQLLTSKITEERSSHKIVLTLVPR